eukprot:6491236-Amphidinium_carterae.2
MADSLGFGLSTYLPKRRSAALLEGQERFVTSVGKRGEKRIAIQDGTETWVEVPRNSRKETSDPLPCLHMVLDQGSIGLCAALYLEQYLGARVTLSFDPLHRLTNDWLQAQRRTGMINLRLAYSTVLKLRHGPWGGSGNHRILQAITSEYFALRDHTCELFQLLASDIAKSDESLRWEREKGTDAHLKKVFAHTQEVLAHALQLSVVAESRWWQFESQSRYFAKHRWPMVLVLVYLGLRRGWYKNVLQSPLFTSHRPEIEPTSEDLHHLKDEEENGEVEDEDLGGEEAAVKAPGVEELGDLSKRTRKEAQRDIQAQKKKLGMLPLTCSLLCHDVNYRCWKAASCLVVPLSGNFGELMQHLKSLEGTRKWQIDASRGALVFRMHELWVHWQSLEYAEAVEMTCHMGEVASDEKNLSTPIRFSDIFAWF